MPRRPDPARRTVALAVFAVSPAAPLGGVGTGAQLALAGMHLTAAAVLVVGLAGPVADPRRLRPVEPNALTYSFYSNLRQFEALSLTGRPFPRRRPVA